MSAESEIDHRRADRAEMMRRVNGQQPIANPGGSEPAPAGPTLWGRIQNGFRRVRDGIVRSVIITGALFTGSYFLGKATGNKGADFLGVARAVENKTPGEAIGAIAQRALPTLAISSGVNFLMGVTGIGEPTPAAQTGTNTPQPGNIPRNNPQLAGNMPR